MVFDVKKVAMTGGSGGVGLALLKKLLSENVEVLLFQRKDTPRSRYLPKDDRLHIVYCSLEELRDYQTEEKGFDVFFHLGWAYTQREMRDNLEEQNKNVMYSCYAVDVAHKLGCHTFIGAGSQAEYGRHNEPLRGDTLCEPENAYGVMKLCACYATRMMCKRYDMRHIWTRILSGYGMYDNINSMLFSNILNSLNGKEMKFSKGEQIWDFVYMDDIADALYLIAQKGKTDAIYPIGSGEAKPLIDYIKVLCAKLGKSGENGLGEVPYSKNQVMHLEADISQLKEDTGWEPQVSFEDGIERVIEFYKTWDNL